MKKFLTLYAFCFAFLASCCPCECSGQGGAPADDAGCIGPECTSCSDLKLNGGETDVDCGGPNVNSTTREYICPRCTRAKHCYENTDCTSEQCDLTVVHEGYPTGGTCL
jgi:hypothetical protein